MSDVIILLVGIAAGFILTIGGLVAAYVWTHYDA